MKLLRFLIMALFAGLAVHDFIGGYYDFATFDMVIAFGMFVWILKDFVLGEAE